MFVGSLPLPHRSLQDVINKPLRHLSCVLLLNLLNFIIYMISTYSKEKCVSHSRGPGAVIVYTPNLPPNLVRMRGNEEPAC